MPTLPALPLDEWRTTRDVLRSYALVVGGIRGAMAPPHPHWWHVNLHVRPSGLSTGVLGMPGGDAVELALDMRRFTLDIDVSDGRAWSLPLDGRPASQLANEVLAILAVLGARPELDMSKIADDEFGLEAFDRSAASAWWQTTRRIAGALTAFAAELDGKKSPIRLWPHHFDLSFNWFSGRLVPGIDPADAENAEEQMGFGFSTGDEGTPEPYVYATAYPWPESLSNATLPPPARWNSEGWNGALLPYADLLSDPDPIELLLRVLRAAHNSGSARMSE